MKQTTKIVFASIKEKMKTYSNKGIYFQHSAKLLIYKKFCLAQKNPVTGHEPDSKNYLAYEPDLMFVTHLLEVFLKFNTELLLLACPTVLNQQFSIPIPYAQRVLYMYVYRQGAVGLGSICWMGTHEGFLRALTKP